MRQLEISPTSMIFRPRYRLWGVHSTPEHTNDEGDISEQRMDICPCRLADYRCADFLDIERLRIALVDLCFGRSYRYGRNDG